MKRFVRNGAVVLLAMLEDTTVDAVEAQLTVLRVYAAEALRKIRERGGRGSGRR